MSKKKYNVIDLFSGAGGMSLGFKDAGFTNIFSVDIEPSFCETYKYNFPKHNLIQKDIVTLSDEEIIFLTKGLTIDAIIGGPPCQGFSIAGNIGRLFIDDPRNLLFKQFARVVKIVKPKFFVMENVARLYTHNKGKTRTEIIDLFKSIGYNVKCEVLNTMNYSVPQNRSRVIFIGSRITSEIIFPKESTNKIRTVKDAIGYLPKLSSGDCNIDYSNHIAMKHSAQMLKKMSYIKDGGNREAIPEKIRPMSGDVRKYIKYDSTKPSICITGDMRKVFHYNQNRALTVRELAAIQTFPDNFIFKGRAISQQQQVGNSVPPIFAKQIGDTIIKMLKNAE